MRVYKFVLICTSVVFIFLHFNVVLCMDDDLITSSDFAYEELDQFDDCLMVYYNPASKTLDLSRLQMGDQWLEDMLDDIKHFVDKYDVKCLLLESMGLTKIPVGFIEYALMDKHLRVVSLQNNKLDIPVSSGSQGGLAGVAAAAPEAVTAPSTMYFPGHLFEIRNISMLWDTFPQEVARDLVAQDPSYKNLSQFKKIIIIDKRTKVFFVFDKFKSYSPRCTSEPLFLRKYMEKYIEKYIEKLQSLS